MGSAQGQTTDLAQGRALKVFETSDQLAAAAAAIVAQTLRAAAQTRLVLAGGSTPLRCYELLSEMRLAWGRVTVLFGDERCVPPSDPESNFRVAADSLLNRVIPASVHRIPAELGPEQAAAAYEPVVAAGSLDLVLLGIGPDGHTASLFPDHPALQAGGLVVGVRQAPKPPPERVSLTLSSLREARRVLMLVSGPDKADAVRRARSGEVPAGMIPRAEWLVTRDAIAQSPL
jgi:6-phosphogluconolactonase